MPFDDDDFTPTALHDPSRATDPCAEAVADRTVALVTEIASLRSQLAAVQDELRAEKIKRSRIAIAFDLLRQKTTSEKKS